jgi:hypothetical protein
MGRVRRKMTSRRSRHGANESNVFFMVLIATWANVSHRVFHHHVAFHTIVPLRAMWAPAVRTRATATLPKLPSPISLITSKRSSKVAIEVCDLGASYVTVIVSLSLFRSGQQIGGEGGFCSSQLGIQQEYPISGLTIM